MWPSQIPKGRSARASPPAIHGAPSGHEEAAVVVGGCRFRAGGAMTRRKKKQEKWANFFEKPQPTPTSTLAKNQKKFFGSVEITWRFQGSLIAEKQHKFRWVRNQSLEFEDFKKKTGPKHDPFPRITCDETAGRHVLHQWNWKWMCQGPQCVGKQEISVLFIVYYAVKYIFNHVIG